MVAELDGIVNEIVHDLLYFSKVGKNHLDVIRKGKIEAYVLRHAGALKGGRRILYNTVDIKIGPGEIALGIQRVQGKHAFCQLVKALCLGYDPGQVFFIHLSRYGAVQNGFQIALDGSQGRAEIMGYIGYGILLVFLHLIQLVGHIIQGVGEITHLIVGLDIDSVIQVTGRVFIGAHCNLAKGQIHGLREYQKDNKGQAEQDSGCDVKYA